MRRGLGLALTFFFLLLLLKKIADIGGEKIAHSLAQVQILYFIAAVCLMVLSAFFQGCRWSMILIPLGKFPPWQTFSSVAIGHWFNAVLPARMGELARPFHFSRKHDLPFITMLATTVVERIFDLLIVFSIAVFGWLFLWAETERKYIVTMLALYLLFIFIIILFASRQELTGALVKILPAGKLRSTIETLLDRFFLGIRLVRKGGKWFSVIFFTMAVWGANILAYWLLIKSCNLPPPVQTAGAGVAITLAGAVTHSIPSTASGLGIINYVVVVALEQYAHSVSFDISRSEDSVLAASIVIYIAALLPDIFIGGFFYWRDRELFVDLKKTRV